jgi:hypothetical protein
VLLLLLGGGGGGGCCCSGKMVHGKAKNWLVEGWKVSFK